MVLGLVLAIPAAHAELNCSDSLLGQISVTTKDGIMEVLPKGQDKEALTIQMTSQDGLIFWADGRQKQEIPMAGAIMKGATILFSFKGSNQAILEYKGDSYAISCH